MDLHYEYRDVEQRWRDAWQEADLFRADATSGRRYFSMTLPPPSITARMHLGHALQGTAQDICARYRRMLGEEVLWLPGTDHAAIGTQLAIERNIAEKGMIKEEIGRSTFEQTAMRWYDESASIILNQLLDLGASLDLSRTRFSMDSDYQRAVRVAFVRFWRRGAIYRDLRVGNQCLSCGSGLADVEVTWEATVARSYAVRCTVEGDSDRTIVVSDVRPELMFGWSGVAVAPDDKSVAGGTIVVPLTGRRVPVVIDPLIKVPTAITPAHDADHLQLARRHGLAVHHGFRTDGRVAATPPDHPYAGRSLTEARASAIAELESDGVLIDLGIGRGAEGTCARCGGQVERITSPQWFLRVAALVELAELAQQGGEPQWIPPRFAQLHRHWLRDQRDWCISRQLWLGHRIPVYTCISGHEFATADSPRTCAECGSKSLQQDPDVLDTWFASALWPFATLGWPQQSEDLTAFYPTNVTVTNREIIGLALTRTVMMGLALTDRVPFTKAVITCNVLAQDGRKMRAASGNAVDPQAVIAEASADALRGWAADAATRAQDIRFDLRRVEGYRRLVGRLWRSAGQVLMAAHSVEPNCLPPAPVPMPLMDRWILSRLDRLVVDCTAGLDDHRFHDSLSALEGFIRNDLSDWYLPAVKIRLQVPEPQCVGVALDTLSVLLRLLHPIMPFVTEELWHRMPGNRDFLVRVPWPVAEVQTRDDAAERQVDELIDAVREVRDLCRAAGTSPGSARLTVTAGTELGERAALLATLAQVRIVEDIAGPGVPLAALDLRVHLPQDGPGHSASDVRRRLRKKRNRLRAEVANQEFAEKADPQVVAQRRADLAIADQRWARLVEVLPEDS